jgi:hypothetical protein
MLGAEHRLVDEKATDSTFADLLETPIQASVEARLDELRARSDAYLDAALG